MPRSLIIIALYPYSLYRKNEGRKSLKKVKDGQRQAVDNNQMSWTIKSLSVFLSLLIKTISHRFGIKIGRKKKHKTSQLTLFEKKKKLIVDFVLLPGSGAVPVEDVEIFAGEQFASVDTRLDGAETAQDADLFDVADQRNDVEPLEFGVDGVQTADQVLQKEFEGLRQTEHRFAVNDESGHLLIAIIDQFALVGRRIGARYGRRAVAAVRRAVAVMVSASVTAARAVHSVRMAAVMVVAVERPFGALQIGGGGGSSCGRCGRCRMAQIQARMVTIRQTGYSGHSG